MGGSPAQPEREGETEKRTAGGILADEWRYMWAPFTPRCPARKKASTEREVVVKVVSAA